MQSHTMADLVCAECLKCMNACFDMMQSCSIASCAACGSWACSPCCRLSRASCQTHLSPVIRRYRASHSVRAVCRQKAFLSSPNQLNDTVLP